MTETEQGVSYNRIYEKLVDADDDLVGLIAYALYKQSKRDWLISHRQEYSEAPTEDQRKVFENSKTEHDLKRLRSQAEEILAAYSGYVIEQTTPEIREKALGDKIVHDVGETLAKIRAKHSFWNQITASFIGAMTYSLLLLAFALILKLFGSDLLNLLRTLGFIP